MIHAYSNLYLEDAQALIGVMIDVAVNEWHQNITDFYEKFLKSVDSLKIAHGDVSAISGQSGTELAFKVIGEDMQIPELPMNRRPEYWAGWALAYYQWYSGVSFQILNEEVPIEMILEMYNPFHEMDIMHFVDHMNKLRQSKRVESYLKRFRKQMGLTQQELAEVTDIPIKTIQQYEQRQKNINGARTECTVALSKALYCLPEELLEPPAP